MMKLAPTVGLAAILGVFMALDRLTLHWYTPDSKTSSVAERRVERTEVGSPTPAPPTTVVNSLESPLPTTAPEVRGAFEALWVSGQRAVYRVRYETQSDGGVAGDSYVVFNRPPAARVDTIPAGELDPSSQLVVDSSGTTVACSPGPSGRLCTPIEPFASPLPLAAGPVVFPAPETFASLSVVEVFPRAVAGAGARCFEVPSGDAELTVVEYCFSIEGVPVYASGPFGVVEASELSVEVSDADFEVAVP